MLPEISLQYQTFIVFRHVYMYWSRLLYTCTFLIAGSLPAAAQDQHPIHRLGFPHDLYPGHEDTMLVNKWLARGNGLIAISPDSAEIYFQQALEKSGLISYTAGAARSYEGLSSVYTQKQATQQAISAYEAAIQQYELIYPKEKLLRKYAALSHIYGKSGAYSKIVSLYRQVMQPPLPATADPEGLAGLNSIMGLTCYTLGHFDSAAVFFYKTLSGAVRPDSFNTQIFFRTYSGLGGIAMRLRRYDQALLYFKYAGQIAERFGRSRESLLAMGNMASVYYEIKKPVAAEMYLQRIQDRINASGDSFADVEEHIAYTRALLLIDQKKYKEAHPYCRQVYASALAGAQYSNLVDAHYLMGCSHVGMHEYRRAIPYLRNGIALCRSSGYTGNNYANLYSFLSHAYAGLGDYHQAFLYRDTAALLSDSMYGEVNMRQVAAVEMKYKTAEKDRQLAWQQLQINRKESKLKEKNLWIGGIVISSLLFLMLVATRYRNRQKLQEQQLKITHLDARMQGEELERGRIAQELHDGVSVLLSAAKMNYTALGREHTDIAHSAFYREGMHLLNETSRELRSISYNLVPEQLIRQSLPAAIQAFCELIQKGHDLTIELQSYGSYRNIPPEFSYMVYRIVQELIQNVVKHARSTHVLVQLILHDDELHLTVEDNGIGFDTGKQDGGMGLQNLYKRIESLQGNCSISSHPDAGTTVEIEIPLSDR